MTRLTHFLLAGATLCATLAPAIASACACGCGIFDTGVASVQPQASDSGLSVFARFSTMNQRENREQGHAASADDNADKRIRTDFYTLGATYAVSRTWLVMAELPIYHRRFTTTGSDLAGRDVIETVPLTAAGDALVRVTYTGLAQDRSSGLGLGVKLPTGRIDSPFDSYGGQPYDRDTMPGTGSTDLELSGYHVGHLAGAARWFVQAQYRFAVATRGAYRPGNEFNGAAGVTYDLPVGRATLAPTLALIASTRARDSGDHADPLNSGYQRLLIAPGLHVQLSRKVAIYGEFALPVADYVNAAKPSDNADSAGQLVSPALFKLQVTVGF